MNGHKYNETKSLTRFMFIRVKYFDFYVTVYCKIENFCKDCGHKGLYGYCNPPPGTLTGLAGPIQSWSVISTYRQTVVCGLLEYVGGHRLGEGRPRRQDEVSPPGERVVREKDIVRNDDIMDKAAIVITLRPLVVMITKLSYIVLLSLHNAIAHLSTIAELQ